MGASEDQAPDPSGSSKKKPLSGRFILLLSLPLLVLALMSAYVLLTSPLELLEQASRWWYKETGPTRALTARVGSFFVLGCAAAGSFMFFTVALEQLKDKTASALTSGASLLINMISMALAIFIIPMRVPSIAEQYNLLDEGIQTGTMIGVGIVVFLVAMIIMADASQKASKGKDSA